ncbi:MAG: UDP-4-amino-4,6-dideoxy-N-acetyl-beta-L-altrosamine transaminase [Anaerovibrio sp.]|uniref:UDP-4-amino-4, 6-dideoxy-N-acetyl-beta-L-altrosamine transaminase n=1 Tax=Anaerovibrio sp. TaxID=1872532 RepID=UPI0025C366B6|nr:UDP-4-amino-4,6-dideoxy-N-acetyl-beta-L-altrosamine transaminase [Anaerovibrio sp.]MBE6099370.1 UDP-4-amino-4,6-dideoxy-N-acetyl-beta-L-altrosamine transaminase [Anaerovibrio sp.]
MEELAINGGKPVFDKRIGYGHQYIDEADIQAVVDVLKSDFLTCGPKIEEAEKKLCDITGAKHAVLIANGTAALHAMIFAAGIGPGDEVITTPLTFAASANCALYCGARPVFADINPETYNIDPQSIEEKITDKTKAVVAVDFTGQAVEADKIRAICDKHNLIFIEDAAHSLGTKYNGKLVGSIADMTEFSFHPVKTCTAGEGGAITTNDDELYKRLVLFRTHGITRAQELMDKPAEGGWYYQQIDLGYNYRMTDMQAALLSSQLDKLEMFGKRRKELVRRYDEAFSAMPEIVVQKEIPESDTVRHLYIIQLNLDMLTCSRREIFEALQAEGVGVNVHYIPVYSFPYYQKLGYRMGECPRAEHLYERIISIPLYYSLTDAEQDKVIKAIEKVIAYYRR